MLINMYIPLFSVKRLVLLGKVHDANVTYSVVCAMYGGGGVIYSCHWAPVHITSASVVGGDNMTSYGRSYQGRVVSSARFQRSHSKLHHDHILFGNASQPLLVLVSCSLNDSQQ